jgi:hypothetical protein
MAEPSFMGGGDTQRRTDSRWLRWCRFLGKLQNRPGSDPANNPRRMDSLRTLMEKALKALQ